MESHFDTLPKTHSFTQLFHRFFQKKAVQLGVIVVGSLMTVVTVYAMTSGQGAFFFGTRAQSSDKILALQGGESALVSCDGKMGGYWADPKTKKQLKILCSGTTPTVTSTAKPTTAPTASGRPTSAPPAVQNTPVPTTTSGSGGTATLAGNAMSFGIWDPVADPKLAGSGPQKYPTCSKSLHDTYFVIGPDGKKYPTWHPPVVVDPATGKKCAFGHDHGRDPSQSAIWSEVQQYFYFDANHNGVMDPAEQKTAGIPFGYVNEQMDVAAEANHTMVMRHEDHVGHKVEFINGEQDAGSELGSSSTGGVNIPIQTASGNPKWVASGVKCYYFGKMHQGVYSKDALTNNLHEMIFFVDCKGPTPDLDQKVALAQMAKFGAAGEFINGCDAAGDRTTPVVIGKDANNQNWPGVRNDGFRIINQKSCIDNYFLVPAGKWSMNMYEAWSTSLSVRTPAKKTLLTGVNITLDVEDSIRHYDPSKPGNIGYNMDLCYLTLPNGNKARGGTCETVTQYGKIKDIAWNDPRSGFKDLNRGMYYQGARIFNAGGPEVWYTDAFGENAQTTPFTGSLKQVMSAKNVDYLKLGNIDPRVSNRIHDDGEGTIHAPN